MLQIQHLSLQLVGHDVDKDDLRGHALGQDGKGTSHTDLADTDNGDFVARAANGLGHFDHQIVFQR